MTMGPVLRYVFTCLGVFWLALSELLVHLIPFSLHFRAFQVRHDNRDDLKRALVVVA